MIYVLDKIKQILSSVRFWQLVVVGILQVIVKEIPEAKNIIAAISLILGGSVVIGTADKISKNIGGNRE